MRQFREYYLPSDANYQSLDDVPHDVKTILDIYEGIEGKLYVHDVDRVNTLLEEKFADQQCFVAEETEDDEAVILAVANYRKEMKRNFGYIEGIAVEYENRKRKFGSYMLDHIAEVTRDSGLSEVRLSSVRNAIGFYMKHGFSIVDGEEGGDLPRDVKAALAAIGLF